MKISQCVTSFVRSSKTHLGILLFAVALVVPFFAAHAATYSVVTPLQATKDGEYPYFDNLTQVGSKLYGIADSGGDSNYGVLFSINADGTGYTIVHTFAGGSNDGEYPYGGLTLSGSKLYGMTENGGVSGDGTIYSINTDGTGFTVLHSFASGASDGAAPDNGNLIVTNTTIYGMTENGGASNYGTIFSMNTDGSSFTLLHTFVAGVGDGSQPYGDLVLSGSTLYGTAESGGSSDEGVIFSINIDGTGFTLLHTFVGGASDGEDPYGDLVLSSGKLYGTTAGGGASGYGTVFSVNTDGSSFTLLHSFAGGTNDGEDPYGDLTLSNGVLYGMTYEAGSADGGTIFSITTGGTGYTTIHSFAGGANDGQIAYGNSLIVSGSTLYGMTYCGGTAGAGVIFSVNNDGTNFDVLHSFTGGIFTGESYPYGNDLTAIGSTLYGTACEGGAEDEGALFSVNTDGTDLTTLFSFNDTDGTYPTGNLVYLNSKFYGVTYSGGANDDGVVYSVNTDGTGFTVLHDFAGGADDGSTPYYGAGLTLSGGKLYGTTEEGGASSDGVVFSINPDGTGFTVVHSFTGTTTDGSEPSGGKLIISNSKIYGETYYGGVSGAYGDGVLYSMNLDGTGFTILHSFAGGANDGDYPYLNDLTLSGSTLYGNTYNGGADNYGVIFSINTDGTGFTIIHSFAGGSDDGEYPVSALTLIGSTLYGVTEDGGTADYGTAYSINTDGTGFALIHSFTGTNGDGSDPLSDLTQVGTSLYGATYEGGNSSSEGTVFEIGGVPLPVIAPTVTTSSTVASLMTTGASLSGDITDTGGSNATSRYIEYGTTNSYGTQTSADTGSFGVGTFSETLSGLNPNTLYHYAACAVNSTGTGCGSDQTFTTASVSVPTTTTSGGASGGRAYVCTDPKATNYDTYASSGNTSCEYATTTSSVFAPAAQILGSGLCPSNLIITQNMKQGAQDKKYSSYAKATVIQVNILQEQINRILAATYKQAAGPIDGFFGPLTMQGVERLQTALNSILKPNPPLVIDGIVGPFTRKAMNDSCGN